MFDDPGQVLRTLDLTTRLQHKHRRIVDCGRDILTATFIVRLQHTCCGDTVLVNFGDTNAALAGCRSSFMQDIVYRLMTVNTHTHIGCKNKPSAKT